MKSLRGVFALSVVAAVLVAAVMFLIPTSHVQAQVGGSSYFIFGSRGSDPCQNPSVGKQSYSVAITSATTTNVVSAVTGNYVTVCKWQLNAVGTGPTIQFEYGTTVSTACDTVPTALTGAVPVATTTTYLSAPNDQTNLRTPVSQQLCIVTGGTITTVEGYVVAVSQPF